MYQSIAAPQACIDRAKERHESLPPFQSVTDNQRRLAGFIAEEVAAAVYGVDVVSTFDYDLVIAGYTVDVKTTFRSAPTQASYSSNLPARQYDKHSTDVYFFVDTSLDGTTVTPVGWLTHEEFGQRAIRHEIGDVINSKTGFIAREPILSVQNSDLRQFFKPWTF